MSTETTDTDTDLETREVDGVIQKPQTAAAWKKAKYHSVVLASGSEIELSIPNLPVLAKTGQIPNDLISAAVGVISGETQITPELLAEQADFAAKLVSIAVHSPKVKEDEVNDLPYEDIELIVEIATRQRDVDALGRQIAGLHKSKEWLDFRAKLSGFTAVEDE